MKKTRNAVEDNRESNPNYRLDELSQKSSIFSGNGSASDPQESEQSCYDALDNPLNSDQRKKEPDAGKKLLKNASKRCMELERF